MTDEHKQYLDELRDSGETNMFGAGQYLIEEFGCSRSEARAILSEWIASYK